MKSASNGGALKVHLQVLHVQVLLVASMDANYMAQPVTDQHKSRVAVREAAYHMGTAAEPQVHSFNDISSWHRLAMYVALTASSL